jgi:adenylate cyclase
MEKTSRFASIGVGGRLLLAFLAIWMFSLIAAGSGFFSLSQVGGALNRVTEQSVPQALSWLELSRVVERVVRAAPALLAVKTEDARAKVSADIAAQARQLDPLLRQGREYISAGDEEAAARVTRLVANLNENLVSLDALVKQRLSIAARRDELIRELVQADAVAVRILAPGERILQAQISEWSRNGRGPDQNQRSEEALKLAGSIVALIPQQKAAALVDAAQNTLIQIASADSAESIDLLIFPLRRSLGDLSEIAEGLPDRIRGRMIKQVGIIESLAIGPASLVQTRKDELAVVGNAEQLLSVNAQLSTSLTKKIDFLLGGAKRELLASQAQAGRVQSLNTYILVGVVALSLVSSILIVWLYVGRNLIARLTGLSDSMLAIAGGNLRAPLPPRGDSDEIGRMAEALAVFRDTAVEVEESNLREIAAARRRLVDAIESSSEGFAFYDPQDRLVICNGKYKELLYPADEASIEPGVTFEVTIRKAAASGRVAAARGRVEEWVQERLASHRNPSEVQIQENDGRWLLISERKTSDGGTVAVYADITKMKQREEELAEKSRALEQLSNQLAKYLSPQIYASIFSGRQQVKIVSQRKRLTVFFSDITGFTETTDRLQSEDLTRLLNHYLTEMSQIALAHGATIDKYVGDAILIFFGDPETRGVKEDAIACVKMGIAMRKRMSELQHVWMEAGIETPLRCRIGINTGVCTVGNFGSETRMDYTIIGSAVNLASRLERACPTGEILISYETHAHVKDVVSCEEHGHIDMKGFAYPIATYRVVDLYENLGEGRMPIHAETEHLQLDVDVAQMSAEEQAEAAAVLRLAAERLSKTNESA